jgi:ligand-binding sensor domain-containing protein
MKITNINHDQGLSNDFTFGMAEDKRGSLWIATGYGLNKYTNGEITSYYQQDGLPSEYVYCVLTATDGTIYAGTSRGLVSINQTGTVKFKNYLYPGDKPDNKIRTLTQLSGGEILLATFGGLKIFDGSTINNYFENDSLRHRPVSTVYEDKEGRIWCAMIDNGILLWDPNTKTARVFNENDGLSSNIVYSLVMDQLSNLWVGTPHGLDKISFNQTGEVANIRHFGAHDGFFGIETNTNAIYQETDGSIWFGTVAGAFKCTPELDQVNKL